MDWTAISLTLRLAATTTLLLIALATPLALWIAARRSWPRQAVQAAAALPLLLPPTVLGFYLLVGLGPQTLVGRALAHLFGHPLAFSFAGLVVGSMLFSLPFAVLPLTAGFAALDRDLVQVAAALGARPWTIFRRIILPLSRPTFLTAALLVFTHTVGEFGVVLMLGGDIPGVTRTLSIALYDQVQEANYRAAGQVSALLVAVSLIALLVVFARQRRFEADLV